MAESLGLACLLEKDFMNYQMALQERLGAKVREGRRYTWPHCSAIAYLLLSVDILPPCQDLPKMDLGEVSGFLPSVSRFHC